MPHKLWMVVPSLLVTVCGAFSRCAFGRGRSWKVRVQKKAKSWGHTFIAIRPDGLVDDFETKAAFVILAVKASGPAIRIPGSVLPKQLPIPEKIWESICNTAKNGPPLK
jgi:LDH2 family malate/lactate/ureidoglycolate dehydrogenase